MTPLLTVENLSIAAGQHTLVHDVSFTLEAGQCIALVGESGAGKSLTGKALLGLLPHGVQTTAGTVHVNDHVLYQDAVPCPERQWRNIRGRTLGFVSQDALVSLDPLRTIGAEIGEPLTQHQLVNSPAERNREVTHLMQRVHIPNPERRITMYPHQLSGGLRQRALIASGIAAQPHVLIADEPTTALDAHVQARILTLLEEIKNSGTGIIMISHDLAAVAQLADYVLVMKDGGVVEHGPTQTLFNAPQHHYTQELIAAHPDAQPIRIAERPIDESHTVLSADNLTVTYRQPHGKTFTALHDVSLTVRAGETLGLVGESGSGKSTLSRLLLAIEHPEHGHVRLGEDMWNSAHMNVSERHRRKRRGTIQLVAQDAYSTMNKRWTVAHIIAEGIQHESLRGLSRANKKQAIRDRVHALMQSVGLPEEYAQRTPRQLSGGQRQRVIIARALAAQPHILVCDEPVSALDVTIQSHIMHLLAHIQAETGVAIVFISHDLAVVRQLAHTIAVLKDGKLVEYGPSDHIYDNPQHPYTTELIAAARHSLH
ncbi:dipeptide ABC transporter ATP-binding protein [Timonella sp. A28]|uniref:dipeptide ABC transporter ATP-binding protein n=1 Tax=Timonella sp. A28 TaxID=3442640 RepID=UPI003EBBABF6